MVFTEIINGTETPLELKEGNAGVYRQLKELAPNDKHTIEIDLNATYREYVVVTNPEGAKVFVTSDDCIDNSTITIIKTNDGYTFDGKPRSKDKNEGTSSSSKGTFAKLWNKIWK